MSSLESPFERARRMGTDNYLFLVRNREELLAVLEEQARRGCVHCLALAYIVKNVVPAGDTTRYVFEKRRVTQP